MGIEHLIEYRGEVPQLIEGMMLPKYRNLYVFGVGQARYGAGPLYTAGGKILVDLINIQKKLSRPIGTVLQRIGGKPLRSGKKSVDVIIDPHLAFGQALISSKLMPLLPFL